MKRVWLLPLWMLVNVTAAQPVAAHAWSLDQVMVQVAQSNRDVGAARRALEATQADSITAAVTPPPQLSLLSQGINDHGQGAGALWRRPIDTILRLDQPIERGHKRDLRMGAADAGTSAAASDLRTSVYNQRLAATQAYWDLKLAQEALRISERNLQLADQSSRAAQARLAQGDVSRLEAARLGVEASKAANEHAQAQTQLAQTQASLALLMAIDAQGLDAELDPWPQADATPPAADGARLSAHPSVQAAQSHWQQAQAALTLAQSQRTPDVTVSLQVEHNPPMGSHLWGVGVAFPLGTDGRQDGPVKRALVALADAQAEIDKAQAQAQADELQLRTRLRLSAERVQRIEQTQLPQARQALEGAEFARKQGALSLQDLLDARRTLYASELDAAAAHADLAKAWSALQVPFDMNVTTP